MDWIHMAQDRNKRQNLVKTVMNLWFPQNAWLFLTSWGTIIFSNAPLLNGVGHLRLIEWKMSIVLSDYTASNNRTINCWWIAKDKGGTVCCRTRGIIPKHATEDSGDPRKSSNRKWFQGRYLNPKRECYPFKSDVPWRYMARTESGVKKNGSY